MPSVDYMDFIPYFGVYHGINKIVEGYESGDMTFEEAASQVFVTGAVGGLTIGVSIVHFPSPGSVLALRAATRLTAAAVPSVAFAAIPVGLAMSNVSVIRKAPEEEQRGLWQMFSSALTGTFGIGSGIGSYV